MRARRYPFLRFSPGVDWAHVKPDLLSRLNHLGALTKHVITVISGYRTDQHSQAVGGFAGDPHTRHVAVDAEIDGKPIGDVIGPKEFQRVGLITGNQPGFYNGKPDPGHVQLPEDGKPAPSSPHPAATQDAAQADQHAPIPAVPAGAAPLPDPGAVGPPVLAPGTVQVGGLTQRSVTELWQIVAQQPNASPDTQRYASLAGG